MQLHLAKSSLVEYAEQGLRLTRCVAHCVINEYMGDAPKLNGCLISSSLSSYHEKTAEALCVGRIQTRLREVFVSKFFRLNFLVTFLICCLSDSTKQR